MDKENATVSKKVWKKDQYEAKRHVSWFLDKREHLLYTEAIPDRRTSKNA
ncbi:hypothetical protein [Dictyobacter halimunensis]